jgi:voltage-gated potassium channel
MSRAETPRELGPFRERLHEIIFEADTPVGKLFDVVLLLAILGSVLAVVLESVASIRASWGTELRIIEWGFTILFTLEYALRLYCVHRPHHYALSFYGIVDVLAVLPSYVGLVVSGAHSLLVIRILRLLRIFRVFKMARYLGEANILLRAFQASARKVAVFLGTVFTLVVVIGALMHLIEGRGGGTGGFANIPESIYWAIVTITTVGYGDIVPTTVPGKMLSATVMILGYSIIAVPTGIVTMELQSAAGRGRVSTQVCRSCAREGHEADAVHCKFCGAKL